MSKDIRAYAVKQDVVDYDAENLVMLQAQLINKDYVGKVMVEKVSKDAGGYAAGKGTWRAHLRNMVQGVSTGFLYEMKIVFAHFPMKVSVKGNIVHVANFLGEKTTRLANIHGNAKVIAKGDKVTIEGNNVEDVGQTAANLEQATVVKGRDIRVFQDGIYVVSKGAAQ